MKTRAPYADLLGLSLERVVMDWFANGCKTPKRGLWRRLRDACWAFWDELTEP